MARVAVVTGAGGGVGRAVVHRLAAAGWDVALVGRTNESLQETIRLARSPSPKAKLIAYTCDIADEASVNRMAEAVRTDLGDPSVVVNNAGINLKKRHFRDVSNEDYRRVIDANLNGAFYCTQAFLPAMRAARSGTIVNVVSDGGLFGNPMSGPSYIASKFGMNGLTQAINAEERKNGIRGIAICPGEIDTPMLEGRPIPPPPEARQRMLQPEDVAACVMLGIELPQRALVECLLVRPTVPSGAPIAS
jgi:NAD(P)-dependent dehydrogenase (short-subunit alcohol dehydrogenase family)